MHLTKVAVSTFLLGLSLYILLPTPDEIIIHPIFGLLISNSLKLPSHYGIFVSIVSYRIMGSIFLVTAIFIGGKPICQKLKENIKKKSENAHFHIFSAENKLFTLKHNSIDLKTNLC